MALVEMVLPLPHLHRSGAKFYLRLSDQLALSFPKENINKVGKALLKFDRVFAGLLASIIQVLVFCTGVQAQSTLAEDKIALVGGTLIDGSGAPPLANAVLLIDGERIAGVGQLGSLSVPDDYTVISTEGRTVMPGLWDMHVHLLYAGHTNNRYWHEIYTSRFADDIMPATALQLLQSGVTSARDLGAPPESVFLIRQQIENGEILGPTVYAAGPQLTPQPPEWAQYYRRNIAGQVNATTQARALIELQADVLKVSNAEELTVDDVRTVTDIAHSQGLLVTAHGRTDAEIEIGLAGGIDEFQHIGTGSEAYPSSLMQLIESRIANGSSLYWTPTIGLPLRIGAANEDRELLDDPENYLGLPASIAEDVRNSLLNYDPAQAATDIIKAKVTQLQAAGVTLLVGTDSGLSGNPHAQGMWQEMLAWVEELDMDPMVTIYTATGLAAQVMGMNEQVGTLEAGKLADVIVVAGNPLLDMAVLRDPELVIKKGRISFGLER
jgi:imidazolonepropionase-like amidohydrolase